MGSYAPAKVRVSAPAAKHADDRVERSKIPCPICAAAA
jgi:hypothetical protein